MEGNIGWQWCWMALLLFALQRNVLSITTVDGQSDPFIYGLYKVNKYSNGSEYESNVNMVLQSLVKAAAPNRGLATFTYDGVYGPVQCRPDVSYDDCQSCSAATSQLAYQVCPNSIGARVHLEFCFIHYDNYSFSSDLDIKASYALENVKSSHDIQAFNHTVANLMETLAGEAPLNVNRFSTRAWVVNFSVMVYALEMCLTTLTAPNCVVCLREAIRAMDECCFSQIRAQLYLGSCSVHFEIYPF